MAAQPRKGSSSARPASKSGSGVRPKIVRSHAPVDEDEIESFRMPRRRERRESVLKTVLAGRGHEFGGVALICFGILLSMSIYVEFAGPLGRLLDTTFSSLLGVGRFVLPVVIIAAGFASINRKSLQHRIRLAFGWTVLCVGVLAVIHIIWGTSFGDLTNKAVSRTGGWFGWIVGEPLQSLVGSFAAVIVLIAVMFCAVLLITGNSPAQLYRRIKAWANGVSRESLRSSDDGEDPQEFDEYGEPIFYDIDLDEAPKRRKRKSVVQEEGEEDEEEEQEKPRRTRKPLLKDKPVVTTAANPSAAGIEKAAPQQMPLGPGAKPSVWKLPNLELLTITRHEKADERATEIRGELLVDALRKHGVETELDDYTRGPTVTRFELRLGGGVKVAKVTSLSKDIAYTMAATDVRILAPIPGKSAIGIEVPNSQRELVSLGDLMVSTEARTAMHPLDVGVGKDIAGRSIFLNISTTPHMLVAGTTGAGKSSAINCIITSVLMRSTPEQVRMILIDPKQVEMAQYARLPHLLTPPVTNPKKAANALGWAVKEMERRYDLLVEAGFRDITGFNAAYDRGELESDGVAEKNFERMPFILIVVDELNDLMMVAARDVEDCITRIAQKARAVGIHLIVATQRPSVNVITGVIKANIPARMAFAVSSLTDSRVILDQPGAEKLIGKGDMLLLPGNTSVAQRVQSAWVDESEVRKVVAHWRRQAPEVAYVSGVDGEGAGGNAGDSLFGGTTGDADDDELLRQAMDLVVRSAQGSTSMLQRKLKIGFARAGRIMDLLESRGVVGPSEGSRPREVLMTVEEL
ncbi:MAG: DNA translocase FtsK 4TM domain-containing protein, partial [Actinomycetes bacterium]